MSSESLPNAKPALIAAASLAAILSITGCGGGGGSSKDGPTDPPPTTPTDPTPTDPTPTDPTPVDPTPTEPSPTDPTPVDPTPTDPTPTDPTPTDPTLEPPTVSAVEKMQQSVIYETVANSRLHADATLVTATVASQKLIAALPSMPAATIGERVSRAHDVAQAQFAKTSMDRYFAQTLMVKALTAEFRDTPEAAQAISETAHTVISPKVVEKNAGQMAYRELEPQLIEEIIQQINSQCRVSATNAAQCDAALTPLLDVKINDSAAAICQQHNFLGCDLLSKGETVTPQELLALYQEQLTKANSKLAKCMKADKDGWVNELCPSEIEIEEANIDLSSAADFVAKYGDKLGIISKDDGELIKKGAEISGQLLTGISLVYRNFNDLSLSRATSAITDWTVWKALIFKEGSLGDHAQIANTIASLVAGFSNIGSAISAISGLLGGSLGGPSGSATEQAILAELKIIKQILIDFRAETKVRFDLLDYRLDTLTVAMENSLDAIIGRLDGVQVTQQQILDSQAALSKQITELYVNVHEMMHDLQLTQLNDLPSLERHVSLDRWQTDESYLARIIRNDTSNSIAAGPYNYTNDVTVLYDLLSTKSMGYLINLMSQYPSVRFRSSTTYSSLRLASPIDVVHIGNLFAEVVASYPEYAKGDVVVAGHLSEIRTNTVRPILDMQRRLQADPQAFKPHLDELQAAAADLQVAIDADMLRFKTDNETSKTDLKSLDFYGPATQVTSHVPQFVAAGRIPGCSSSVSPITLPSNWRELMTSNTALVAEALGNLDLSVCFDGIGPNIGGWKWYREYNPKDDRFLAYGSADYGIFVKGMDGSGSVTTIKMIGQTLPPTDDGYGKAVCIYYSTSSVRNAGATRTVAKAVSASWEGEYTDNGGGFCATDGFRMMQTKAKWEGTRWPKVVKTDWDSPSTASNIATADLNERGLAEWRKKFATKVSAELKSSGAIGTAAKRYETARRALMMTIRLAYPSQSAINPALLSLLSGKQAVPSISDFVTYVDELAASGAATPIVVNDAAEFSKKAEALSGILENTGAAVRNGELVEPMVELEALDAKLEVLQSAVAP